MGRLANLPYSNRRGDSVCMSCGRSSRGPQTRCAGRSRRCPRHWPCTARRNRSRSSIRPCHFLRIRRAPAAGVRKPPRHEIASGAALGSLDRVKRIVKVLGMVNSADGFGDETRVINGFSDLMVEVFGEAIGKHARSAVGMAWLPFNNAVEVEMIVEVG